jgi:hypothetical protein
MKPQPVVCVVAKEIALSDESAAMDWIDANQLGRRNLTPDQMSYIRGRLYNRKKQKHGGQLPKGKCQSDTSLSPDALCKCGAQMWEVVGKSGKIDESQSDTHQKDTATAIATAHGVSRRTVIRDGKREDDNGGVYGRQPMAACTAFVCLLNTVFEKQRSDGKRKNGQHPRTDHSVEALSLLGKSGVFLSVLG